MATDAVETALRRAGGYLIGASAEVLEQLEAAGPATAWLRPELATSQSWASDYVPVRSAGALCNQPVQAVVQAWRALSAEAPILDDSEYYTEQFLTLSCYGSLIADEAAAYLSLEDPPTSDQVFIRFEVGAAGARPAVALWGALPLLAKPGRLAAQLWLMLRFDDGLAQFDELREAMCDGFLQVYVQDALDGGSAARLRLHIHCVLCLLEIVRRRRRMAVPDAWSASLPDEAALREALRQEVLLAASFQQAMEGVQPS